MIPVPGGIAAIFGRSLVGLWVEGNGFLKHYQTGSIRISDQVCICLDAAAVTLWAKQKRNEQNVKNDDAAAKGLSERLGQMVRKFRFPPNAEPPLP